MKTFFLFTSQQGEIYCIDKEDGTLEREDLYLSQKGNIILIKTTIKDCRPINQEVLDYDYKFENGNLKDIDQSYLLERVNFQCKHYKLNNKKVQDKTLTHKQVTDKLVEIGLSEDKINEFKQSL